MAIEPITFIRTGEDGKTRERAAFSPADIVALRFDGWVEKPEPPTKPAGKADADGKAAGKTPKE